MNKFDLVKYLKSQYKSSSIQLNVSGFLLTLATIPAAASIYVGDDRSTYYFAIANGVFVGLWLLSLVSYQKKRHAAHGARRAALLTDSFNELLSPLEIMILKESFTVDEKTANQQIDENYYASSSPAGFSRLLDNIQESAFYTSRVQEASRNTLSIILVGFGLLWLSLIFISIPSQENETLIDGARLFMVVTIFFLSGGLFRSWIDYGSCAKNTGRIEARCIEARNKGSREIDILMILLDYSGYIDSSPEALPYTYSKMRNKMESSWSTLNGKIQ